MNINFADGHTRQTLRFRVEDGPIRPKPYSRTGKQYRVSVVTVEFFRPLPEGNWKANVSLSGTDLKKDGTDGQTGSREHLYSWSDNRTDYRDIDWVRDLVAANWPTS